MAIRKIEIKRSNEGRIMMNDFPDIICREGFISQAPFDFGKELSMSTILAV